MSDIKIEINICLIYTANSGLKMKFEFDEEKDFEEKGSALKFL